MVIFQEFWALNFQSFDLRNAVQRMYSVVQFVGYNVTLGIEFLMFVDKCYIIYVLQTYPSFIQGHALLDF